MKPGDFAVNGATVEWSVVFRNGHPYAAFATEQMAREFIADQSYRRRDCVAPFQLTFTPKRPTDPSNDL